MTDCGTNGLPSSAITIHLFCRVVDYWGDAGVALRLARACCQQLPQSVVAAVHLYCDDLPLIARLLADELAHGLVIHDLNDGEAIAAAASAFGSSESPAWLIETFACPLPSCWLAAIDERHRCQRPWRWVNIDYLATEPWADRCHGLPSPQPESGLLKTWFIPGFSPASGGLLRPRQRSVDGSLGPPSRSFAIFWFTYDLTALYPVWSRLTAAWSDPGRAFLHHYPDGITLSLASGVAADALFAAIADWAKPTPSERAQGHLKRGWLTIKRLPWLPQQRFDELLQRQHLNIVRGEDSFVQASFAPAPLIWRPYPQADNADSDKLTAWLAEAKLGEAHRRLIYAFNDPKAARSIADDWQSMIADWPTTLVGHRCWQQRLMGQADMLSELFRDVLK